MLRLRFLPAALLLVLLKPAAAQASDPPAHIATRLTYVRGPRAEGCPDEAAFRDRLAAQFGYDPIEPAAGRLLTVAITRAGPGFQALMTWHAEGGAILWGDRLEARDTCARVVESAAIMIKIGIDTAMLPAPTAPRPLTPAPPAVPAQPPPPVLAPLPAPLSSPRPKLRAGLGTSVAFGLASAPAAGISVQLGVRWPLLSLSLEGLAELPAGDDTRRIATSLVAGTFLPCFHVAQARYVVPFACGLISAGVRQASTMDGLSHGSTAYVGAGARGGAEVPLGERFALRFSGDLLGAVRPSRIVVNGAERWTSPPVAGGLGAGALVSF